MVKALGAFTVGIRLKQARLERGLSRQQLGKLASVGTSTIQNIEDGRGQPRNDTVEALATALQVSPCWLGFGLGKRTDAHEKAPT